MLTHTHTHTHVSTRSPGSSLALRSMVEDPCVGGTRVQLSVTRWDLGSAICLERPTR